LIDLALLGLLREHELHGYELKKRLADVLGPRSTVSFGSLYPALARLEAAGEVKAVEHRTSGPVAPSSGSLKGELAAFRSRVRQGRDGWVENVRGTRGKKVYGITERGDERLHELLVDPDVSDDRTFTVRVAFCRHLDPAERLTLFERRRAELARRIDERVATTNGRARDDRSRLDTYLRSLWEHDTDTLSHDLAWLDRLIDQERTGSQETSS
jgi:DNA-binding PadR family transcriptional regulator